MHGHNPPTRRKFLAALTAVVVMLLGALTGTIAATATATRAGASSQIVTYSLSTNRPGTLPNTYPQVDKSDGWAVALTTTQVFAVTHHQQVFELTCWNQSNAGLCWPGSPTKVVTNSAGDNFATSPEEGLWLNQATGKLYAYAVETNGTAADDTAGVVCVNTQASVSATGQQLFCGFTPLSATGDATYFFNPLISAPVLVGSDWYAFNNVANAGVASGTGSTQNTLMCFDTATLKACADQPFTVPMGGMIVTTEPTPPPIGASGDDVFIPTQGTIDSVAATELGCFDTDTDAPCASPWPISVAGAAGSPFPLLNGTAQETGVCLPITGNPCWSLAGTSVATPANMTSVIGETDFYNGPAVVFPSTDSIYVANWHTTKVACYDYATDKSCANFPKVLTNLGELYTVNTDPYRPNCLWVNSDHGVGQIQNFDATTGGACAPGPVRLQTSSVVQPQATCQPTGFQSLQITSPPVSSYGTATVQFASALGVVDTSIPAQKTNSFGVVNLGGLNFSTDPSPQFVITFNHLTPTPATISLRLTWYAQYSAECLAGGQSVSNKPGYWMVASDGGIFTYGTAAFYGSTGSLTLNKPIVGMAVTANRKGYWLVASDGGIFAFGDAAFYGSTGSITLNKPIVGMAPTPDGKGYWLVASDGGIFAFGDAAFYGSTGSITLNKPIVGMASTPDGGGYWMVASDGGIFAFGDAVFYGSTGSITLNKPIVGMAAQPNGGGYWMVASDGGIFSYGTSRFFGSTGSIKLNKPIVGMATNFNGTGYWLAASDGGIFNYGASVFAGSAGSLTLNKPIVGMTA